MSPLSVSLLSTFNLYIQDFPSERLRLSKLMLNENPHYVTKAKQLGSFPFKILKLCWRIFPYNTQATHIYCTSKDWHNGTHQMRCLEVTRKRDLKYPTSPILLIIPYLLSTRNAPYQYKVLEKFYLYMYSGEYGVKVTRYGAVVTSGYVFISF